MSTKITPTVGRVVWFHPIDGQQSADFTAPAAGQPLAAIIVAVKSSEVVNLTVFDAMGFAHARINVPLLQEGDDAREGGFYATWMPYQVEQAKKHANEIARADAPKVADARASALTFGTALMALKTGQRVARAGWNGRGMFVYLVPANSYPAQTGAAKAHFGEGALVPYNAYLALKGADDTVSTWAPSGSDALAEDWLIVE